MARFRKNHEARIFSSCVFCTRVVSGIIGSRILWKIFQKMKPRSLEKSSPVSIAATLQISIVIFLLNLGCFSILCTPHIADNEGHPTNVISGRHLLGTFQI